MAVAQAVVGRRETWLGTALRSAGAILRLPRYRVTMALVALLYLVFYLFSLQNIVYMSHINFSNSYAIPSVQMLADWPARMLQSSAPFVWEPVGTIFATSHLMIMLSVPNLAIGLILGLLVGANMAVAFYGLFHTGRSTYPGGGARKSLVGMLSAIPGLFTGFACCVPVVIISLGSLAAGLTAGFIAVRPFLIPVSLLLMVLTLLWSSRRLVMIGCPLPRR